MLSQRVLYAHLHTTLSIDFYCWFAPFASIHLIFLFLVFFCLHNTCMYSRLNVYYLAIAFNLSMAIIKSIIIEYVDKTKTKAHRCCCLYRCYCFLLFMHLFHFHTISFLLRRMSIICFKHIWFGMTWLFALVRQCNLDTINI